MPVDLTEVRQLFFEESFENLDVMESSLLELEVGSVDKELINNIFRAAHSIKGGAGIFKLEQVIEFSHTAETLLDEMRNGQHMITQTLIDLLLRAVDVMRMMLSGLLENTAYDVQEITQCQQQLQQTLKNSSQVEQVDELSNNQVNGTSTIQAQTKNGQRHCGWQINFKPDNTMLKTGNDPVNLFREIERLGELEVKVNTSQLPNLKEIQPQHSYLSWELILRTHVQRALIDEIFEWVVDECDLQIVPLLEEQTLTPTQVATEIYSSTIPTKVIAAKVPVDSKSSVKDLVLQTTQSTVDELEPKEKEPISTLSASVLEPSTEIQTTTVLESSTTEQIEPIQQTTHSQTKNEPQSTQPIAPKSIEKEPNEQPVSKNISAKITELSSPTTNTNPDKLAITPKEKTSNNENANHYASESSSIRVNIDKIDILINLVGELVITQSMLDQVGENFDNSRLSQLRDGLSQLERNTRELQESVMRIRMLPISYSFNRFPRLVHDLSVQLGKKVELKLSGEHTELDKTVLEKMSDPLVHLVRNALDHGIEAPEQRRRCDKPQTGLLHLHAFHQGGNIVIQISDDGAGFDFAKIRKKAMSKGLLNPEDHVTDEQLHEFIFLPGFSTAEQVSDLSGRGVGMDVVRRNIRALGGTIDVKSQPGKGSTFSIRLPLTLAILDGQLVRVGEEIYILPLLSILESLRINPKLVSSMTGRAEVYRLRDEYIPILRLYSLFDVIASTTQLDQGLLVIVEGDGQKIGLFVDELLSQQQIVIKSLETNYKQIQGISGATILGDGSVALILDIAGLISLFHQQIGKPSFRPSLLNRSSL